MKRMDASRVSSEELIEMFEKSFEIQVAGLNNISTFGVDCENRGLGKPVQMKVDISGHAGTPTIDEFKNGTVKGCNSITISREDIGSLDFKLLPKMTTFLSGNDYLIIYEAV